MVRFAIAALLQACHAPETIWLSNMPKTGKAGGWLLNKLGSLVDPLDANLTGTNVYHDIHAGGRASSITVAGGRGRGVPGCNPHEATCGVHLHAVQVSCLPACPDVGCFGGVVP